MKYEDVIITTNKLNDYILGEIGTGTRRQSVLPRRQRGADA